MEFDILTIFPGMFVSPLDESILKRARLKKIITINTYDLRDFTDDKHRMTDDYPYGGGSGMVMKPEPIFRAVKYIKEQKGKSRTILLSPQGRTFDQDLAKELAKEGRLILVCGRYEGVDERVREELVDDEVSIGDYVLTGGELAAMVIVDAVARLIPNVLGGENSAKEDSFYNGILEYPHYTRPFDIEGLKVPEILLSGNHEQIRLWRRKESLKRTLGKRPDLIKKAKLSDEDKKILSEIRKVKGE